MGTRVVDLTTRWGDLAGRILAELGAEVVKIEAPGGATARRLGPFVDDRCEGAESSLTWMAVGRGKKSVVIDRGDANDRAALAALVAGADVLIDNGDAVDTWGLSPDVPSGLIWASVTPYGLDGPKAHWAADELSIEAAGGLLSLQGDPDRPHVPVGYQQASCHAGGQAAADICIALYERDRSGHGQCIDTSAQAAVVLATMHASPWATVFGENVPGTCDTRAEPREFWPGLPIKLMWQTADGWAQISFLLPEMGERTSHELMAWAEREGMVPDDQVGRDWHHWKSELAEGTTSVEEVRRMFDTIADFVATRTKREIFDHGLATRTLCAPIYTAQDVLDDRQLEFREYFEDVEGIRRAGRFAKMTATPLVGLPAAPILDADSALRDRPWSPRPPTPSPSGPDRRSGVFDGLKVADFAWVGVGPLIARALADQGATTVRIESEARPDMLRQIGPFAEGVPGLNRSQFFAFVNTSKVGLACDLSNDAGRDLARRMIDWADVVIESFTPGTMARFGVDYDSLSREHPDLVMLSTCLRGQDGPERRYGGFGSQGVAVTPLFTATGWPDRPPAGPWGAYTDFCAPRFGISALAAALLHRRRTGVGQHIDLSQVEAAMHFAEPLLLDRQVNDRDTVPQGHLRAHACPHTLLPTAGHDRFVTVACETPQQWRDLVATVAPLLDEWSGPGWDDVAVRAEHRCAIEDALRRWSLSQEPFALAEHLATSGVPSAVVHWSTDLLDDPQLRHRGYYSVLDHGEVGPVLYDGTGSILSETPSIQRSAAPCLGEHTDHVLRDLLCLTDAEIARYRDAGALR
ncbi:MAG: CoA transferase [Acidimicrobiia bacterium]|nr:CoA transferase [Acidimicrobiia bacterium]